MRVIEPIDVMGRRIDGSELELRDCARLTELFFVSDVSSRGLESYDAWAERCDPDRIERVDIDVLNKTFRVIIIKLTTWEDLYTPEPPPWLAALDPGWDLVTATPETWQDADIPSMIETAIRAIIEPRPAGVPQATRLLHMKRRHLVPVLDSYVARAVHGRLSDTAVKATRAADARVIIEHLRVEGRRLRPQLEAIQAHLGAAEIAVNRSLARILDVLLWTSEDPGWKAISEMLARYRAEGAAG